MAKAKAALTYFQQGDVLLKQVVALPEGLVPAADLILQRGETTGHKHQFRASDADRVNVLEFKRPRSAEGLDALRITEFETVKYVQVADGEPVLLYHEEHKPIAVPPGLYEMDIVREYDYNLNEVARVVD